MISLHIAKVSSGGWAVVIIAQGDKKHEDFAIATGPSQPFRETVVTQIIALASFFSVPAKDEQGNMLYQS